MPTLEINATQPWFIAPDGNVAKITDRLAVMNPALRGIEVDFGPEHADTFLDSFGHRVSGFYQLNISCGSSWSRTMRNSPESVSVL